MGSGLNAAEAGSPRIVMEVLASEVVRDGALQVTAVLRRDDFLRKKEVVLSRYALENAFFNSAVASNASGIVYDITIRSDLMGQPPAPNVDSIIIKKDEKSPEGMTVSIGNWHKKFQAGDFSNNQVTWSGTFALTAWIDSSEDVAIEILVTTRPEIDDNTGK